MQQPKEPCRLISIRLPASIYSQLTDAAQRDLRTISSLGAKLIAEGLARRNVDAKEADAKGAVA